MAEVDVHVRCEKACEILRATNDGDDLDPRHLWLVQEAVNGHLSEEGWTIFEKLCQDVKAGYKYPLFHGIENMIRRPSGSVFWKGHQVEHYDSPWAYSDAGRKAAEELAQRCRYLESIGVEVNTTNAIWRWEKYQPK